MRRTAVCLLLVLSACIPGIAQQLTTPSKAELDSISTRGRLLYESDEAAWHSTDAVQALHPPESSVRGYLPVKTDTGWKVAYGRLNEAADKFLVAYLAVQGSAPDKFTVETHTPPKEDSGFFLFAAKARLTAQKDFGGAARPYNVAALPAADGKFYIYVYPAQTVTGVYPIGGDVRYLISADGAAVLEKHQMHKSILDFDSRGSGKGSKVIAGFHTHVLSDLPEDTDVFHVLTQTPPRPEMVRTEHYLYAINESGGINIVENYNKKK